MERYIWIDRLRVVAIFFVLIVHSTEPFYLGGEGTLIMSKSDVFWVAFFDSIARACVPLFIIASSYLLFPLRYSTSTFFRKRAVRVVIPFLVWTFVYALVWGEPVRNFKDLLLNFNYAAGHLWFVYMLVGIYLLLPLLSPWAAKVSRRELLFYLLLCLFTSFIPYFRDLHEGQTPVIFGPSGIPNFAKYPLWGESSWNSYGLFYYFSGFIGYILLGLYIRRFVKVENMKTTLLWGVLPLVAGFCISFFGFAGRALSSASGVFPYESSLDVGAMWEVPLFYDSVGVALMALGWLFLFRKFNSEGKVYSKITLPLSKASYGVYLSHMLILAPLSSYLRETFGIGSEGRFEIWTTPMEIFLTAIMTFILASVACLLVRRIPGFGKLIVG